jgi:hypothetical protein
VRDALESPEPQAPARSRNRILRIGVVLYLTLGILAVTIPQNLVNWLKGLKPSPAQEVLIPYAEGLERIAARIGTEEPYKFTRALFLKLTGKDD